MKDDYTDWEVIKITARNMLFFFSILAWVLALFIIYD